MVKTERSEVKPPISSSIVLDFLLKVRRRRWMGKESEVKADVECLYCAGLFSEDQDGEDWVRRINYPE
jgi:hypothetical protein